MKCGKKLLVAALAALVVTGGAVAATLTFHAVAPSKFDPGNTKLVASQWIPGIGCPTNAKQSPSGTYTDDACATGDPADKDNKGLLMAKTGPTSNNAAAFAQLKDVPSPDVTELGYDIRKPGGDQLDPRGSHCGGGAPRFEAVTTSGTVEFGPGCNNPPTSTVVGQGWLRLRWTTDLHNVKAVYIAFDEGQDTGPDNFGAAVLDNIEMNGTVVGH
jgi:hypothetical protein